MAAWERASWLPLGTEIVLAFMTGAGTFVLAAVVLSGIDSDVVAPRDMWLRAATTKPGNPKVVHHIIVRLRQPSGALRSGPGSR